MHLRFLEHVVVRVLGKLSPERLMEHSVDIVATYESDDGRVRKAAIETLSKLRPEILAQRVDPDIIISKLQNDQDEHVRAASADFLDTLTRSQRAATALQAAGRGWQARGAVKEKKRQHDALTGKQLVLV